MREDAGRRNDMIKKRKKKETCKLSFFFPAAVKNKAIVGLQCNFVYRYAWSYIS